MTDEDFTMQDACDAIEAIKAIEAERQALEQKTQHALSLASDYSVQEALRLSKIAEDTPANRLTIEMIEREVARRGLNVVPFPSRASK